MYKTEGNVFVVDKIRGVEDKNDNFRTVEDTKHFIFSLKVVLAVQLLLQNKKEKIKYDILFLKSKANFYENKLFCLH